MSWTAWDKIASDEYRADIPDPIGGGTVGWRIVHRAHHDPGSRVWIAEIDNGRGWTEVEAFYRLADAKAWAQQNPTASGTNEEGQA